MNVVDEAGSFVVSYTYTDYGETSETRESECAEFENIFRYTGGVYDEASGLYYLNARYYDPDSGRFLSRDSYRGEAADPRSQHLYGYCYNNPINHTDASGRFPDALLDGASLYFSVKDYSNDRSVENAIWVVVDTVALLIPLVPGSYAAKGLAYAGDAISGIQWSDRTVDSIRLFDSLDDARDYYTGLENLNDVSKHPRMTTKEAEEAANKLGYYKVNGTTKTGEAIFYNKKTKTYISQDVGSQNGMG